MRFKSGISVPLLLWISLVMVGTGTIMATQKVWPGLIIDLLLSGFILHMYLNTYYEIEGSELKIVCGLMYKKTVDITSITRVKATRNPISSPALSLDRIEIICGRRDRVIVSPKDKEGFVSALVLVQPGIVVEL